MAGDGVSRKDVGFAYAEASHAVSDPPDPLDGAIQETIAAYPGEVERWRRREAGAWAFLAGQGVLAYRRLLGRRLSDAERRSLWSALWEALERQRR